MMDFPRISHWENKQQKTRLQLLYFLIDLISVTLHQLSSVGMTMVVGTAKTFGLLHTEDFNLAGQLGKIVHRLNEGWHCNTQRQNENQGEFEEQKPKKRFSLKKIQGGLDAKHNQHIEEDYRHERGSMGNWNEADRLCLAARMTARSCSKIPTVSQC